MQYCPSCGGTLTTRTVEEQERLFCTDCDQVIWQNPKPVAWVLLRHDDTVLLVKRAEKPDKGQWDVPGGFLEVGEPFAAGAIRELREETGIILSEQALTLHDTLSFDRNEEHVVGVVFTAEVDERPDTVAGDDAEDAQFWSLAALKQSRDQLRAVCAPLFYRQ